MPNTVSNAQSSEAAKLVQVLLTDGSLIQGEFNTRQYTLHGRLSDAFNHPDSIFMVLTNVTFLRHAPGLERLPPAVGTMFINKRQIVFAMPQENAAG